MLVQSLGMPTVFKHVGKGRSDTPVALTKEVEDLLSRNAVVAVGVSGGKDSDACAIAVSKHLDAIGHTGPRVLVHADLGRVEWKDSLPGCQRLAEKLGWELIVVQRKAGDMLDRWQGRWSNNVARFNDLSCVKIILPWSTPSMRFCTSELKSTVIASALKKKFPGHDILNVTGIRRQESDSRSKASVSVANKSLKRRGNVGFNWNAIIEWPIEDVIETIWAAGLRLHEAYTVYGTSRVSCAFCIMSSATDLLAAAGCSDNHDLYRQMVELEIQSTFGFQGHRWLADAAPHLLTEDQRDRVALSKIRAAERQALELKIPKHLLFVKGVPECIPTHDEAVELAKIRFEVSRLIGANSALMSPSEVISRYQALHIGAGGDIEREEASDVELCS